MTFGRWRVLCDCVKAAYLDLRYSVKTLRLPATHGHLLISCELFVLGVEPSELVSVASLVDRVVER